MFCPRCGKMNPDEKENCSGCGAVLHEPKPEEPKKKKSLAGRIIAAIAALAVAGGGCVFALTQCSKDNEAVQTEAFAQVCLVENTPELM